MKLALLCIGDELLTGYTVNTNAHWIGDYLRQMGLQLDVAVTCRDEDLHILRWLDELSTDYDLVITTGGLGPTKDDITKSAIAAWLGVGLIWDQTTYDRIRAAFALRGIRLTEAHKDQCHFPEGVELVRNEMGTAPGMVCSNGEATVISLPGVPYEMKHLLKDKLIHVLTNYVDVATTTHTFMTAGTGETSIAESIADLVDTLPAHCTMAYLPSTGNVRVQLKSRRARDERFDTAVALFRERLGQIVFSETHENIAAALGRELVKRKMKLTLCESCTGGYLAHQITSNSGSSAYYDGSYVSYANEFKSRVIGVNEQSIIAQGAVSEQVVREMVAGSLAASGADVAIAVSGIAGPTGGTVEKPVGTFWVAWGSAGDIHARKVLVQRDRMVNIRYISTFALNALRLYVINKSSWPK